MKIVSLKDHICTWKVEKRYGIKETKGLKTTKISDIKLT